MTSSVCYVLFAATFHTQVISSLLALTRVSKKKKLPFGSGDDPDKLLVFLLPICLSQSQPVRVFAVGTYHLRCRVRSVGSPHVRKLL